MEAPTATPDLPTPPEGAEDGYRLAALAFYVTPCDGRMHAADCLNVLCVRTWRHPAANPVTDRRAYEHVLEAEDLGAIDGELATFRTALGAFYASMRLPGT